MQVPTQTQTDTPSSPKMPSPQPSTQSSHDDGFPSPPQPTRVGRVKRLKNGHGRTPLDRATVPEHLRLKADAIAAPLVERIKTRRAAAAAETTMAARKEAWASVKQARVEAASELRSAIKAARTDNSAIADGANRDGNVVIARLALQEFQRQLTPSNKGRETNKADNASKVANSKARGANKSAPIGKVDLSTANDAQRALAEARVTPLITQLQQLRACIADASTQVDRQAARERLSTTRANIVRELEADRVRARSAYDEAAGDETVQPMCREDLIAARHAIQLFRQRSTAMAKGRSNRGKARAVPIGNIQLETATETQRARANATILPRIDELGALHAAIAAARGKPARRAARQAFHAKVTTSMAALQSARKTARAELDAVVLSDDSVAIMEKRDALIDARLALELFQQIKPTVMPLQREDDRIGNEPSTSTASAEPTSVRADFPVLGEHNLASEADPSVLSTVDQIDVELEPLRNEVATATDKRAKKIAQRALKTAVASKMAELQQERAKAKATFDAADETNKKERRAALQMTKATIRAVKERMQQRSTKTDSSATPAAMDLDYET